MKTLAHLSSSLFGMAMLTTSLTAAPIEKEYSLKLSRPGEPVILETELRFGSITVQGYKGETVEIKAIFKDLDDAKLTKQTKPKPPKPPVWDDGNTAKPRNSDGLKRVTNSSIHLDISERDNEVEIESDLQNRLIELIIKVPYRSNVDAELYAGGDIVIKGITGELELSNHRGGISAIDINGPVVAETWRSDIVVNFQSYNTEHPSSFTTHHGNIDITVPEKKAKANLMVQTYRGEILSGLATNFQASDEIVKSEDGEQEIILGGAMVAKLNGGGQMMSAQTYAGNIYVRTR